MTLPSGANPILAHVFDKQAISDAVIAYATTVDAKDWAGYAQCFTDPLFRDFSTFAPDVKGEIGNTQWACEVSQTLAGFDVTQHNSTNHVHTLNGDEATCRSYMTAEHVFVEDGKSDTVTLGGIYTNTLRRTDIGWKISGCELAIRWSRGNMALFEKAVNRVIERCLAWTGEA